MGIYSDVLDILEDYLGPAADRYIRRQVDFHLEKSAEELTASDMIKFSEWVRSSFGLLTSDKKMVDEASDRLLELSHE